MFAKTETFSEGMPTNCTGRFVGLQAGFMPGLPDSTTIEARTPTGASGFVTKG